MRYKDIEIPYDFMLLEYIGNEATLKISHILAKPTFIKGVPVLLEVRDANKILRMFPNLFKVREDAKEAERIETVKDTQPVTTTTKKVIK